MKNEFLETLTQKPIVNTFRLAYKILLSNKLLFILVSVIFIFLSIAQTFVPLLFLREIGEIFMVLVTIVITGTNIVSQIFTESNYLYISRMVLDSHNEEECLDKMSSTKISKLFFDYFTQALGSSLAIVLVVVPLMFIREKLNIGESLDMFLMALLLLALYVYPIVTYKITLSKNFKEAFVATFLFFSPLIWKQSLNHSYSKFVISLAVILSGVYYILEFIINSVSDVDNSVMSIISMIVMMLFSMFFALYVLPASMMIAQRITADNKDI